MFDGTVLIRADASPDIGFGHVSRCLALARELRALGARVVFAVRGLYVGTLIRKQGFEARVLAVRAWPAAAAVPDDELELLGAMARGLAPRWVVVDHYGWTDAHLDGISDAAWRLALLDDVPERRANAVDLLVNPSLGADASAYMLAPRARALFGPRHAPLDEVFARRRACSSPRSAGPLRRLLVVLGGADTAGRTPAVVAALDAALAREVEIRVIRGPLAAAPAPAVETSARVVEIGALDPPALADEILAAQAAVTTPSTICWEMATLGLPMVLLETADNQALNAREMRRLGAALIADGEDRLDALVRGPEGIGDEALRGRLSRAALRLTDGRGASRIARALVRAAPDGEERACAS